MKRSVIITTPMPTWEETVARYGLSKSDQKFVIRLVERKTPRRPMAGGTARKKSNRARASA